jgi:hypothetical protein
VLEEVREPGAALVVLVKGMFTSCALAAAGARSTDAVNPRASLSLMVEVQ